MKKFKQFLVGLSNRTKEMIASGAEARRRVLFNFMCGVLSLTSLVMSIVNIFTAEYALMISTFSFSLACLIDIVLVYFFPKKKKLVGYLFGIESLTLLTFFLVSGIPTGFSVLWYALVPSFALLVFGLRAGGIFSTLIFIEIVFFYWIPWGQSLLMFEYTEAFMLRFPFFYVASVLLSLVIEYVRAETQNMVEVECDKYDYLYRHDLLTGLYNRYGIEEFVHNAFENVEGEHASVIMIDIDNFKDVNDKYGHDVGDEVLKTIAGIPAKIMCDYCRFCRWGGEEFLLVMCCHHDVTAVAESLRQEIEKTPTVCGDLSISVTASFGVTSTDNLKETSMDELYILADKAMYKAKENGRNRVEVCLP